MDSHGEPHAAVAEPVDDVGVGQFAEDTGDSHELYPGLAGRQAGVDSHGQPHAAVAEPVHGVAHAQELVWCIGL